MAVSVGDVEDTDDTDSQQLLCTDTYCKCPYHKNNGPPPPSPPPRRRQAWEDTVEKVQLSLLGGITTKCITASCNDVGSFVVIYIP